MTGISRRTFVGDAMGAVSATALQMPNKWPAEHALAAFDLLRAPDVVDLLLEGGQRESLRRQSGGDAWLSGDIEVRTLLSGQALTIGLASPTLAPTRVQIRWRTTVPTGLSYLGDHWERSYGDLEWRHLVPDRVLPWYFLVTDGHTTSGFGVKTGARAFAFWQMDAAGVSLWCDVRNGGSGVRLGQRHLDVATVVSVRGSDGESAFGAAQRLCRAMCDAPKRVSGAVYGSNNWYYAYGVSSADDIMRDAERVASFAPRNGGGPRPFTVVDDGWQLAATESATDCCSGGPWRYSNSRFGDMAALARRIKALGVRPGIWMRPLKTQERVPESWVLSRERFGRAPELAAMLDPTVPDVLQRVREDVRGLVDWGYELVKHDFSTADLLGRWGFRMGAQVTDDGWRFADQSKTTAEAILDLYRAIREGAGDAVVIGCNTVGHLGAGLFEVQRIGDDTSGKEWDRTRRMGVNALAFRLPQHGTFFAADADCVGVTKAVPWELNARWMDLVARSGTPLFVSVAADALGAKQAAGIKEAFAVAAEVGGRAAAEPLDWMDTTIPSQWRIGGREIKYEWFGEKGAWPLST
jgi:alpha-galactosidase